MRIGKEGACVVSPIGSDVWGAASPRLASRLLGVALLATTLLFSAGCGSDEGKTAETAETTKTVTDYDIVQGQEPVADEVVAVDAFVRPILEELYGSAGIESQSEAGAPVVSLRYEVGLEVAEGDEAVVAERLQAAGGQAVSGEPVVDYARPEAPVVQVRADIGGATRTVRVTLELGTTIVYVNSTG
jgi:hypothetical protein